MSTAALAALCYAAAFTAGWAVAIPQAILIADNRPIRHGRWLAAYVAVACALNWLAMPTLALSLLLLPGIAGVFSATFRVALNDLRGLPWHYLGPDPANGPAPGRSRYDLLMWRMASLLHCRPATVAITVELTTAIAVYILSATWST